MNSIQATAVFSEWLKGIDKAPRAKILARIVAAEAGNFGDHKPVGDAVCEMRINAGPGYRLYYVRVGAVVYLLLCGGDKSSQDKDIAQAKKLARRQQEDVMRHGKSQSKE